MMDESNIKSFQSKNSPPMFKKSLSDPNIIFNQDMREAIND